MALHLSRNSFIGTIPPSLAKLTDHHSIELDNNNFTIEVLPFYIYKD